MACKGCDRLLARCGTRVRRPCVRSMPNTPGCRRRRPPPDRKVQEEGREVRIGWSIFILSSPTRIRLATPSRSGREHHLIESISRKACGTVSGSVRVIPRCLSYGMKGPGGSDRVLKDSIRVSGLMGTTPLLHDCSGNWDHLNLIFPVYLKLMTGFPSYPPEDVGAGLLH